MPYVEKTVTLKAPASEVWELVGDFERVLELGGAFVKRVELEGSGEGAIRTMYLSDELGGGYIRERQVTLDNEKYYSDYDIIERGAVPFVDYLGAVKVGADDTGGCIVRCSARFKVTGVSDKEGIALSESNLDNVIRELKTRFSN